MTDIKDMAEEFKNDVENEHIVKQQAVITKLLKERSELQREVDHLKELLTSLAPLLKNEPSVVPIVVTPEEGLIDRQVQLIRERGLASELTLEDTKKLDLLLKNKSLIKSENKTIQGESKKIEKKNLSNAQLIQIASQKKLDNGDQ